MEGSQAERECSAELVAKENRLKEVCARDAARLALLDRHSAKLCDEMRRLTRALEADTSECTRLQSRLKTSMLNVEGGEKEVSSAREVWRKLRVEEALLRLRAAHAARAVAGLDQTAFSLDKQRLHLEAAMNERIIEINSRRDMFGVQKRALLEDCGKLRSEIREREQRIDQLKKRYDILIESLGKDESGQQLSVTFFKIKFAAERAELRAQGAALDAEIARRERDLSALEATLRVVHAAHAHFMHHISPLKDDAPEMEELHALTKQYYEKRDELKALSARTAAAEQAVADAGARLTILGDKCSQLTAKQSETEIELENARERKARQESRLQNALEVVRHNAKRARKLVEDVDDWRIFQLSVWVRDYAEAAYNSLHALAETCAGAGGDASAHLAALIAATDISAYLSRHQRRLHLFIQRIVADAISTPAKETCLELNESVFSSSSSSIKSGVSVASGYTKRLSAFRRSLAPKVQEPALIEAIPEEACRSTVSLRVVTLGFQECTPAVVTSTSTSSRKSLRRT